ncbi:hypothetical protein AVEN_138551-1 [Araneus ventricosus]|uniref:Uncharacterized protein n=1 Tax=Araneus ventricosus TaxID=182803 RepID=A0A4Y2RLY1_ARAVE|nr:hypothetical protein AVEN_138551-1 [Araneus ventricosus]
MLQVDLSELLRCGCSELHKWVSNHPALFNDISTSEYSFEETQSNTVKELGMLWKPQPDQLIFKLSWRHVSSKLKPADVLSRGTDARDLRGNDLWWQGPEFLLRDIPDREEYPCSKDKTFEQELKRYVTASCAETNDSDFLDKLLNLTNNYSKLIRILSFCCMFFKNCLHKNVERGFFTAAGLDNTVQLLIKQV